MMRTILLMLGGLAACNATNVRAPRTAAPSEAAHDEFELEDFEPARPVAIVEPIEAFAPAPEDAPQDAPSPPLGAPANAVYALRSGETLDHFARWSGIPVEDIAENSGLSLGKLHDVGTEVVLEADDDLRATIDLARDAHHSERAERYLARRGGLLEHVEYSVRTGDTAWGVANAHGDVPVWLLEGLNPTLDLDRLRPGQVLTLPVTADMAAVADAGDPTSP